MKKLIALCIIAFCLPAVIAIALPGSVTYRATWNSNTESDLSHYSLYWRTSTGAFNETNKIATIPKVAGTTVSYTLTGSVPVNTIIAVTASDVAGNESAFSTEVPFVGDVSAPGSPGGLAVTKQ